MDKDYVSSVIYAKAPLQNDDRLLKDGDFVDFELFKALCDCPRKYVSRAFYNHGKGNRKSHLCQTEIKCPTCGGYHVRELNKAQLISATNDYRKCVSGDVWLYPVLDARDTIHCDECKSKRYFDEAQKLSEQELIEAQKKQGRENAKKKMGEFVWKGEESESKND